MRTIEIIESYSRIRKKKIFYLFIGNEEELLTGIELTEEKVAELINDLDEAACNGAPWPVYEVSDR